ncbi:DUF4124 domain-containing protein [Xanthomonas campestris]|uniref:DUF4124 domain-containing protein n=1 Tax=Xanthomonas campestris TaxID=339 RepID=UPI00236755E2|nr:DUF4124 domain-containing protein [Xanthomonas campestris]MEA9838964.1 DUF4124 domain-containing protein [Xanthomonas campestris pv. raphani]WDJ20086.1 DUF4124 domain-containing protein [Xanthomonas campestris pv. raphani]
MDSRFLVLLFAALSMPAQAQYVYKCRQRGQVVYQSEPCVAISPEKVWDATPVPEQSNAEKWRLYRIDRQLKARNSSSGGYAGGASVSDSANGSTCQSARASRSAAYEAAGVHRDFALSSYWDNVVHNACK